MPTAEYLQYDAVKDFVTKDMNRVQNVLNQKIDDPTTKEIVFNTCNVSMSVPKSAFADQYKGAIAQLMKRVSFLNECGARLTCVKTECIFNFDDSIVGSSFYIRATFHKEKPKLHTQ